MATQPHEENDATPTPTRRMRWATRRLKGNEGKQKRASVLNRFHIGQNGAKRDSGRAESLSADPNADASADGDGDVNESRSIFFNVPLPPEALDQNGRPAAQFKRNKIRTAKYTPLSFIPKNLFYQFHNVANCYFLFLVILAFFSIFGAPNPGLNAVPLIFILFVTAVKDAIEDYRRTILDNELNNSPVHRLVNWNNVNVSIDSVGPWRKTKKAVSRNIVSTFRAFKRMFRWKKSLNEKGSTLSDGVIDENRNSVGTQGTRRDSVAARDGVPMTPVRSRLQRQESLVSENPTKSAVHDKSKVPGPYEGWDMVNHNLRASGKPCFQRDYWKNVQVGDFVRIYNDDQIPADIVILSTSEAEGACYVETKNLDGETNLKLRHALHASRNITHARDCERAEFKIESEAPQPNLYQYSGVVRWSQEDLKNSSQENLKKPSGELAEPITINNLLLRGTNLRNTKWVLGVVIFTGGDTKIMINSGITPTKRSRIARELNWDVVFNFFVLFLMCFISGLVQGLAWAKDGSSVRFFEFGSIGGKPSLDGLITFWAALILFQNLVPISLFISLEIIKTAQAFFIYSDTHMYYEKLDYPCTPKSWNISDDLGQIEYIFSDKTGTLTQNVMEFKKATINGIAYGEAYTEAQAGMQRREGIDTDKEGAIAQQQIARARVQMIAEMRKMYDNVYLHDEDLTFIAPDFITALSGGTGPVQQAANYHFMLALALCHTVISELVPGDPPKIEFKAQSPDEAALVATARDVGFTVLGNTPHGLRLNILGEEKEYTIMNTLEFNSNRKRMSVIVRMPDNKIMLFCKGADSMIYSRLNKGEQSDLRRATAEHLEMFAREGLRTLCIAQKTLGEEEYQAWNKEHELASEALQNREEKLEVVADIIERELTLLGGTAIEDRLQEGVPDTIALLAEAGIKLWVLTGDKVETAINIGFSCNLLNNDMELIILNFEDEEISIAETELDKHLQSFGMTGSDEELTAAKKNHGAPAQTHAIVIDGDSLKIVLDDRLRQKFLLLCKQCRSILCCRVSPAQKAAVVHMVKNGLDVMTLSIGDGANDVAMIQEADVGVGIAGEEGRQAAMSSDYAIGQFRFLQRLILVHGRWSYRRLGETIANFFYKTIVWTFAIFWYQIYTNFDQTYLYDYTYILLYTVAFTSIPVIFLGILDQDVNDKVSLAVPQLYRRGIERKEWTQRKFWLYMLDGTYQSVICFFIPYLTFSPTTFLTVSGQDIHERGRMGLYIGLPAIIIVNTYILLNTYRWDWLILLLVVLSILLAWFWTGVYSAFESSVYFYKAAPQVFGQASFWVVTLLTVIISLLPRFVIKSMQKMYFPYDVDIIREQIRQGKFKHLDDEPEPIDLESVTPTSTTQVPQDENNIPDNMEPRLSVVPPMLAPTRTHTEGQRRSYDRIRPSLDRTRLSFEASNDFTSAAMLARVESSHSVTPVRSRVER